MDTSKTGEVLFDITSTATAKPATKPAEPVRTPGSFSSPGVSAEGAERAKADEAAAKAAGFSPKPPIYEIGSLVNQWGVDNFRASRSEYEDMPSIADACAKLIEQVGAEARKDFVVNATDLQMFDDGRLSRGSGALYLSERALSGLATFVTPGGGGYLAQCPSDLRAINVNHWLENAYVYDAKSTREAREEWEECGSEGEAPSDVYRPREITLRTRTNKTNKKREVFAIVGPRYSAHDIDVLAAQVMEHPSIPADARCDITYDGYKARINVLFHSNVQPEKVVAGEIFKAGFSLRTADDGTGSIMTESEIWRNLCLNLIIIDHAREMVMRRRHVGDGIAEAVELGIEAAMSKVQYFADAWSEATVENVIERYGVENVEDVFRRLVANKVLHVPNVAPERMMQRLLDAYQKEPGSDKTAIVNAVTRAAHESEWPSWEAVSDLERVGGQLLFAPVWDLQVDDKAFPVLDY